jgi:hypothetical protein
MSKLEMLKNRQCVLENTGTVEELRRVLKYCFPSDTTFVTGIRVFYWANRKHNHFWAVSDTNQNDLPAYSTSEFIAELDAMEANAQPSQHVEKEFKPSPFYNWHFLLDEETCIKYLKERNYKILKPIIKHEEI